MNHEPAPCIIFDRDGTILDFSEMFYQFIVKLYQNENLPPPDREIILSLQYWLDITRNNLTIGQIIVKEHVDNVPRKYMRYGRAYPGVHEALTKLHAAGLKMGMVSGWVGTEPTQAWLETIGLASTLHCVLTADDLRENQWDYLHSGYLNVKAALFEVALMKLGASPSHTWIVGDSPEDIAAANMLGANSIAVLTGNGQSLLNEISQLQPHLIIESAAAVLPIFTEPDRLADMLRNKR
jgi:phosphoglycolate phosphatase